MATAAQRIAQALSGKSEAGKDADNQNNSSQNEENKVANGDADGTDTLEADQQGDTLAATDDTAEGQGQEGADADGAAEGGGDAGDGAAVQAGDGKGQPDEFDAFLNEADQAADEFDTEYNTGGKLAKVVKTLTKVTRQQQQALNRAEADLKPQRENANWTRFENRAGVANAPEGMKEKVSRSELQKILAKEIKACISSGDYPDAEMARFAGTERAIAKVQAMIGGNSAPDAPAAPPKKTVPTPSGRITPKGTQAQGGTGTGQGNLSPKQKMDAKMYNKEIRMALDGIVG